MTQLDNITWFPQILWLFIIFFILYVLVYKYFGPLSFFNQQMRTQKIQKHYSSIVFYDYLNVDTRFKRFNVVSSSF